MSFELLDDNLLVYIFSFLKIVDLIQASRVKSQWFVQATNYLYHQVLFLCEAQNKESLSKFSRRRLQTSFATVAIVYQQEYLAVNTGWYRCKCSPECYIYNNRDIYHMWEKFGCLSSNINKSTVYSVIYKMISNTGGSPVQERKCLHFKHGQFVMNIQLTRIHRKWGYKLWLGTKIYFRGWWYKQISKYDMFHHLDCHTSLLPLKMTLVLFQLYLEPNFRLSLSKAFPRSLGGSSHRRKRGKHRSSVMNTVNKRVNTIQWIG